MGIKSNKLGFKARKFIDFFSFLNYRAFLGKDFRSFNFLAQIKCLEASFLLPKPTFIKLRKSAFF